MSDCRPTSLLHKVQMARIFADSKTFVDMSIKRDDHAPNDVLGSFDDLMAKVGRGVEDAVQLLPSSRCIGPGNNVPSVRTGSVKFQLPGRVLPRVSRILLWLTLVPWKKNTVFPYLDWRRPRPEGLGEVRGRSLHSGESVGGIRAQRLDRRALHPRSH